MTERTRRRITECVFVFTVMIVPATVSYSQSTADPWGQRPAPERGKTPSAPPQTEAGRTQKDVTIHIPSEVQFMYVFLQDPKRLRDADGCIPAADAISSEEFRRNFDEYRSEALRKGMKLIITATPDRRDWVTAAGKIRINGKRLKPEAEYSCHAPRRDFGYEVEL